MEKISQWYTKWCSTTNTGSTLIQLCCQHLQTSTMTELSYRVLPSAFIAIVNSGQTALYNPIEISGFQMVKLRQCCVVVYGAYTVLSQWDNAYTVEYYAWVIYINGTGLTCTCVAMLHHPATWHCDPLFYPGEKKYGTRNWIWWMNIKLTREVRRRSSHIIYSMYLHPLRIFRSGPASLTELW